jgi:hypothetical protein
MECKPFYWAFAAYRCNSSTFIVVANCENHGLVQVFRLDYGSSVQELSGSERFPELRHFYPWEWDRLPALQRSTVRSMLRYRTSNCDCHWCSKYLDRVCGDINRESVTR